MEYNQFSDIKSIFKNFFHKKEDFNNKELISKKENFSNKEAEVFGKRVGIFFATIIIYGVAALLFGILPTFKGMSYPWRRFLLLLIFIIAAFASNYVYYYYLNGEKEITDLLYEGATPYIGGTLLILLIALASAWAARDSIGSLTFLGKGALGISLILYVAFIVVMVLNLFELDVLTKRVVFILVTLALVIIIFVIFRFRIFLGLAKVAPEQQLEQPEQQLAQPAQPPEQLAQPLDRAPYLGNRKKQPPLKRAPSGTGNYIDYNAVMTTKDGNTVTLPDVKNLPDSPTLEELDKAKSDWLKNFKFVYPKRFEKVGKPQSVEFTKVT